MSPTATATRPKLTPDDLFRLPDRGKGYELVGGELKELNVSILSSFVAGEVYSALKSAVRGQRLGWLFPEGTSFRCFPFDDRRVRRADTAFISLGRLTHEQAMTEGHCTVVPDLVVEVVSPNDLAYEVELKTEEWLAAGVRLVWVVHPSTKRVHAFGPDGGYGLFREADTLTAEPVLPGFGCPVADLFRLPAAP